VSEVPRASAETSPDSPWAVAAAAFTRWRDGDAEGLNDLVRVLSPVRGQVVRATGLDRERAEDVVQTTWIALVDHADSLSSRTRSSNPSGSPSRQRVNASAAAVQGESELAPGEVRGTSDTLITPLQRRPRAV
jgi:hypothetical protein